MHMECRERDKFMLNFAAKEGLKAEYDFSSFKSELHGPKCYQHL